MAMNEIALFKGVRIQPYFKHIDFIFAGVFAFIFLAYRILMLWQGYISQQKALNVVEVYQYFKPHFFISCDWYTRYFYYRKIICATCFKIS